MSLNVNEKIARSKRRSEMFAFGIFRALSFLVVAILFVILGFIVIKGGSAISWKFLTTMPTNGMTGGGILPAIIGTFCLVGGSILFSFPIGVLAGIYMNEYAKNGPLVRFIRMMTNNLAGIPSIVFGLFGVSFFVITCGMGDSIIAGSLTLGILTLPVVIRTTEEALKSVDNSFRHGSYALGATKIQTIHRVVLPISYPNIITGLILSIGRVSGEVAPILFIVAYFTTKLPTSVKDQVMALPYHLYVLATSGTDIDKTRPIAYGTALVLIAIVLIMNLLANALRRYFGKKVKMN
ncbi:MAG: phosphate ABC transporter permease PstA [Bacteroidetes bacterium]|nr:phosphate ABC transporter permease PstA [Bacteroidota bacterium]